MGKVSFFFELGRTLFYAFLIAVVVRTFAYEPFNIPSGSMMPTLLVGDHLFVSKYSYGYSRYSLPFGLPLFEGRIWQSLPERGDVAVFRRPGNENEDYIKRIIGLPGDTIQVKKGILHINGKPVQRQRIGDYIMEYPGGLESRTLQYIETLPNGRQHLILEQSGDVGLMDNTGVYTVPEGMVFGMGDNRDNSRDSRDLGWVGFIPLENLVGRAEVLFLSTEGNILEFYKWRLGRFFNGIE
ncbi:MAG: signal peptidase I [Magnetospiraceae bacterium]